MEAKANKRTKRVYCSLISDGKRLSDERGPKTDYSSRQSYDTDQKDRRLSALGTSPSKIKEKAMKIFELCPQDEITEEMLAYLVGLTNKTLSQKDLLEILLLKWTDRKSFFANSNPQSSAHMSTTPGVDAIPIKNRLDNVSSESQETILWSIFNLMNEGKEARMRKFAAYVISLLTFNSSTIQNKICQSFGFSPISGIVIFNKFPKNIFQNICEESKEGKKKEISNIIEILKNNCDNQHTQFLDIKDLEKRLLFFCYPDFDHELSDLNDFPDPWEYLIGFFVSPIRKAEKEVPLAESISTPSNKANKCSFATNKDGDLSSKFVTQSYTQSENLKKNPRIPAISKHNKPSDYKNPNGICKTARTHLYKIGTSNKKRKQHSNKPNKREEFRRKFRKQGMVRSHIKYTRKSNGSGNRISEKAMSVTDRLTGQSNNRANYRYNKISRSLVKASDQKYQGVGSDRTQFINSSIGEYYCQMTNNINISVDFDKKYMSNDSLSDKNFSISSNSYSRVTPSIQRKNQIRTKIKEKQQKCKCKNSPNTAKKLAGKHISIVLNAKNPELGEGIDIQVCSQPGCDGSNSKELEETKTEYLKYKQQEVKRPSARRKYNLSSPNKDQKPWKSGIESYLTTKKKKGRSPGSAYSAQKSKGKDVKKGRNLSYREAEVNIFDTGENEPKHKSPPQTIISKPKIKNDNVKASLSIIDKNLEYLTYARQKKSDSTKNQDKNTQKKYSTNWRVKGKNNGKKEGEVNLYKKFEAQADKGKIVNHKHMEIPKTTKMDFLSQIKTPKIERRRASDNHAQKSIKSTLSGKYQPQRTFMKQSKYYKSGKKFKKESVDLKKSSEFFSLANPKNPRIESPQETDYYSIEEGNRSENGVRPSITKNRIPSSQRISMLSTSNDPKNAL